MGTLLSSSQGDIIIEFQQAEAKSIDLKIESVKAEAKSFEARITQEIAETKAKIVETQAGIVETQVKIEKSRSSNLRWTVGLLLGFAITNFGAVFGAAPALIRVFG